MNTEYPSEIADGDGWKRGGRYYWTKGRFTICAASVRGEWKFTLTEGDTLVLTGTSEQCKAEAARRV